MGKRIIQQARGKGSHTYRVRKKAFMVKPGYPVNMEGEWKIVKLIASAGHSAPIAKIVNKKGDIFYNIAANLVYEGQEVKFNGSNSGDIAQLGKLPNGTKIFNIETKPKDGGKMIRSGGGFGTILGKKGEEVRVLLPSKRERKFDVDCRASVGRIAGEGRTEKPILKAGKKYHIMKAKSKLWPRTSAVKMNAIDHPFGSGRGKRPKSKIVPRMSSPGRKVGLLKPKRTGRKKK